MALMNGKTGHQCGQEPWRESEVSLPVIVSPRPVVRRSRTARWRAGVLVAVHLLMLAHITHWLLTGRSVSPVEPSEAMYTLNQGYVNAGFLFFAFSLLLTLLLGRFVCGWGCHFVAYQDLCAWALRKIGIRPKAFRSRLLVLAPLALAVYMFVWPSAYRLWVGGPAPSLANHLTTTAFWQTFPGPVIATVTVVFCGFAIVYFLGGKGFCTYACPYGGFFGLAETFAPGRILVTDACEHCGHCTAACSSNVRVHEEVARYGMVVDPGCMKCMDCVSVCPNDALHFGFSRPAIGAQPAISARPASSGKPRPYDFSLWEELLMIGVGIASLITMRGLYGRVPLLLAMGLAAVTGFVMVQCVRLIRTVNVRFQNLQLKRGGRLTRSGVFFSMIAAGWFAFMVHSGIVQYEAWRGGRLFFASSIGDEVWRTGSSWWKSASPRQRADVDGAITALEHAHRWGLLSTPSALRNLVRLYLAKENHGDAERVARRYIEAAPNRAEAYRGLAGVFRKAGRVEEAEAAYRQALALQPNLLAARNDLMVLLEDRGRNDKVIALYREAAEIFPDDREWSLRLSRFLMGLGRFGEAEAELMRLLEVDPAFPSAHVLLGVTMLQQGRTEEGVAELRTAIRLDPDRADAEYDLGMALLDRKELETAVRHLQRAVELDPARAKYQYNLGVAMFMAGRVAEAEPYVRETIHLDPDDPDAYGFLAVVLEELGDTAGARHAQQQAKRLTRESSPR